MKTLQTPNYRTVLLGVIAASIIGWGCAIPVQVATESDPTVKTVYLPAAQKGDAVAQLQLALAYRFGTAGAPKDPEQAWQWLNKAASNNLLEAQIMLGDTLISGNWGNPKNIDAGLEQLRSLAEKGPRDLQEHLGMVLLSLKEERYTAESAVWFEKAARAGNKSSARQLAKLYQSGNGVKQDTATAYAWFAVAGAALDMTRIERTLSKSELNRAQQRTALLKGELAR